MSSRTEGRVGRATHARTHACTNARTDVRTHACAHVHACTQTHAHTYAWHQWPCCGGLACYGHARHCTCLYVRDVMCATGSPSGTHSAARLETARPISNVATARLLLHPHRHSSRLPLPHPSRLPPLHLSPHQTWEVQAHAQPVLVGVVGQMRQTAAQTTVRNATASAAAASAAACLL